MEELYQDIFATHKIDHSSKILEIGIGTGQATLPFLKTGCSVTAVERGGELSGFVKQKFAGFSNFDVVNIPFEEFERPAGTCDLIYSASAFHWIPEEIGY